MKKKSGRTVGISCWNGRGLNRNTQLIRRFLIDRGISVHTFTANLRCEGEEHEILYSKAKYFCKKEGSVICTDGSLPTKKGFFGDDPGVRLLIAEPYGFMFERLLHMKDETSIVLKSDPDKKANTFRNFTHILTYSSLMYECIKKYYNIPEDTTYLSNCGIPLVDDLFDKKSIAGARRRIEDRYPQVFKKKIIAIIGSGSEKGATDIEGTDIEKLYREIPDGWILITNILPLYEKFKMLPAAASDKLVHSAHVEAVNYLYAADIFAGTSPAEICAFAASGRPFAVIETQKSAFSTYVSRYYDEIMLKSIYGILDYTDGVLNDTQKKFAKNFAPEGHTGSVETIGKLFL